MNEAELLTFKDTRKDKSYFDKYIKSNNKWMNISALRLVFVDISQNPEKSNTAATIFCNKTENYISALYSRGVSKNEFLNFSGNWLYSFTNKTRASFNDIQYGLSLAILTDQTVKNSDVNILCEVVMHEFYEYELFREMRYYLINKKLQNFSGKPTGFDNIDNFTRLLHIENNDDFLKSLHNYMKYKWYDQCKDESWYDSHKKILNTYVEYWSFLSAAICKMRNVQFIHGYKNILKDAIYVPTALI